VILTRWIKLELNRKKKHADIRTKSLANEMVPVKSTPMSYISERQSNMRFAMKEIRIELCFASIEINKFSPTTSALKEADLAPSTAS
jgi:hypothetical protein